MKKYLILIVTIVLINTIEAQVTMPAAYSSGIKVNYVRTWDAMAPITHPDTMLTRPAKDVRQTTQYMDGLGRPLQTVIKKGSLVIGSSANDFVAPVVYDEFGRQVYNYLPFAANTTGSNTSLDDGYFKLNAFQQDSAFNKSMFPDEAFYYSKTGFESSPLNRVLKTYAPGNNWVGSSRGIGKEYTFNESGETAIRQWSIASTPGSLPVSSGVYPVSSLYRNGTFDENGNLSFEYVDKEGKTVIKSLFDGTDWHITFYVYDDLGNLRCVIPPKAVPAIWSNWTMTQGVMDELCFRYEYDSRNRMILKKVPGAGIVYMIYDARDRLVMSQDSVLRAAHKWNYILYDGLNRPTITGLITDGTYYNDAAHHRALAEGSTAYPNPASFTDEVLTQTYYDNYDWLSSVGNPFSASRLDEVDNLFITPSNNYPYPQAMTQSSATRGMVTGKKVKVLGTDWYLYSINFYDDKGRVIQTRSQNMTGWTDNTITQYDFSGKILRQLVGYANGGINSSANAIITNFDYDDLGRVTAIRKSNWGNNEEKIVENSYNALGQLQKNKLAPAYNSNAGLETLNYDYNIRGWLLGMNRDYLKNSNAGGYAQRYFGYELGYDKLTNNAGYDFYHDAQYNGNICGMVWKSTGDQIRRKYDFRYDGANRLGTADFEQNINASSGGSFSHSEMDFSVYANNPTGDYFIKYDLNGNILNMVQRGYKLGQSPATPIDELNYMYYTNSNKLKNVIDDQNDTDTKLGDFRSSDAYMTALSNNKTSSATDYTYDANGNMNVDNNKDISSIVYNHLNLPDSIIIAGKGSIKYVYDAEGNKKQKIVTENNVSVHYNGNDYTSNILTTTLYLGGAPYETKQYSHASLAALNYSDRLDFIPTEEGRMRVNADNSVVYDYMIKDHLGNVRMVLTDETDTAFYPAATMETASIANEETFYSNLSSTQITTPGSYPGYGGGPSNGKVAKVSANTGDQKVGPAITLKVMAGDKFNLSVYSWWNSGNSPNTPVSPLTDLVTAISGSAAGLTGGHYSSGDISGSSDLSASTTSFLNTQSYPANGKPKAYINWVLFDEQFKFVSSSSGYEQVGTNNTLTPHNFTDKSIDKNGYLYIYVSNATDNINVYFDNLQVTHIHGPLVEETHYYPFGLTMAGISSKALSFGGANNKMKFQGQEFAHNEFSDGGGLDMYEFKWRMDDPQIGRFWQVDPLADKYVYNSPYAFSENQVTAHVELEGLEKSPINGEYPYLNKGLPKGSVKKSPTPVPSTNTTQKDEGNYPGGASGATLTVTGAKIETTVFSNPWLGTLSTENSESKTVGKQGFVNSDLAVSISSDGKPQVEGAKLSVGPISLGTDFSGVTFGYQDESGAEVHLGTNKNGLNAGISFQNNSGVSTNIDVNYKPGDKLVMAGAQAAGVIIANAVLPGAGTIIKAIKDLSPSRQPTPVPKY